MSFFFTGKSDIIVSSKENEAQPSREKTSVVAFLLE